MTMILKTKFNGREVQHSFAGCRLPFFLVLPIAEHRLE